MVPIADVTAVVVPVADVDVAVAVAAYFLLMWLRYCAGQCIGY